MSLALVDCGQKPQIVSLDFPAVFAHSHSGPSLVSGRGLSLCFENANWIFLLFTLSRKRTSPHI